jgi:hypothetical protein
MSTYQDEIFNYLTKKDNFFSAYEIYQAFPEVKKTLIEQYWQNVKDELIELTKNTNWKVELSENVFETYSKLRIWLNGPNEGFGIVIEKLHGESYHGLWIDVNNKQLDRARIDEYTSKIEVIKGMKKNNYWLGWTYSGVNFDSIETLKKILPDNRMEFAHEFATMLYKLAEELNNDVLKMSEMKIL